MRIVNSSRDRLLGTCVVGRHRHGPMAFVLKVEGIGACDHVLRASMLGRLVEMTHAQPQS